MICVPPIHPSDRDAFFSEDDASQKKKWVRTLARSLGDYSIKCTGTDRQVAAYLMKKLEQFYELTLSDESSSSSQLSTKHAVTATGLQLKKTEDGKKLWVLNHLVHIDDEGKLVDPKDSSMVWLGQFFPSDSERASLPASQYLIDHFASIATPELEASIMSKLWTLQNRSLLQ